MIKIWGRTDSSNVQKVLWCCGELGLEFERVDHAFYGLALSGTSQTIGSGKKREILAHGQVSVQGELLGHIAQVLPGLTGAFLEINAQYASCA